MLGCRHRHRQGAAWRRGVYRHTHKLYAAVRLCALWDTVTNIPQINIFVKNIFQNSDLLEEVCNMAECFNLILLLENQIR